MTQHWLRAILFTALGVCAGCGQVRNYSAWGHTDQMAVPVDYQAASLPEPVQQASWSANQNSPAANFPDDPNIFALGDEVHSQSTYEHFHDDMAALWPEIKQDYRAYYSWDNLALIAGGFSVAAVWANTPIDEQIREEYQENVRTNRLNDFGKVSKLFGTGGDVIPAMAAAWATGELFENSECCEVVGEWGGRSLRSLIVGAPPMVFGQFLTGGSRPGESSSGSHWKPFQDDNGVSGHAFIGAVAFINAAKMSEDPWLKASFYACSFLPGWSRANTDSHYFSQIFLGWWMGYAAATAVDHTQRTKSEWQVVPAPIEDGAGLAIMRQF